MNRIWITWEFQRRSIELARHMGCRTFVFDHDGLLRYPVCIARTLLTLLTVRPKQLFVQNPSMILAAVACLYRFFADCRLVIDRHSTFSLSPRRGNWFKNGVFRVLNRFTIQQADLTLVTNKPFGSIISSTGGKPFILPDKLPRMNAANETLLPSGFNVLFICSYHEDEPVSKVIQAMAGLQNEQIRMFVSGNPDKLPQTLREQIPDNMVLTGFLGETEFVGLLHAVDAVMVLTTAENTLLCGCYEAVAAGKALITSRTSVLMDYFTGSVFVDNTAEGIAAGLREMMTHHASYRRNIHTLKDELERDWNHRFATLEGFLNEEG